MPDPTNVGDCALVFGIPLSAEAFIASYEAGHHADFAFSEVNQRRGHTPQQIWRAVLAEPIGRVLDIADEVAAAGVHVVEAASLDEVVDLFGSYQVVTLVTHWRGGAIAANQVTDAGALRGVFLDPHSPLASLCGGRLSAAAALFGAQGRHVDDAICATLNEQIYQEDLGPSDWPRDWHRSEHDVYRSFANRASIDDLAVPGLALGNRFEINARLFGPSELKSAIPVSFDGILDLATCNSIMAAESIKRDRHFSCIANEEEASLLFRMEFYLEVIALLAAEPCCYLDAYRELWLALLRSLPPESLQ